MHHAAWVIAPLVLAGVLGFSAATKVGKGEQLRKIIRNLELRDTILPVPLARAIPGIELALALGLLVPWLPSFTVAAWATLLLTLVYWVLIARGMTLTPRPTCGCFGQAGDHQISWRTVLRNTLLVAAAVATVALAASGRTAWSSFTGVGDWLWLLLAGLACAVTVLVLARSTDSEPTPVPEGPASDVEPAPDDYLRTPTPELALHNPESGPVTLLELSDRRAQLLVFVNCYCASTKEAMADIAGWNERIGLVDVRMVFSVPIAEKFVGSPPPGTLLDHRGLAWRALGLRGSPSAVLLGVDGHLAGGPVSGSVEVRRFVDDVEETLKESVPSESVDDGRGHEGQQRGGAGLPTEVKTSTDDEDAESKSPRGESQLTGDR